MRPIARLVRRRRVVRRTLAAFAILFAAVAPPSPALAQSSGGALRVPLDSLVFGGELEAAARVRIFGVDGRLIRTLDAPAGATSLVWDGRDLGARPVPPGLYLAQMETSRLRANL